MPRRYPPEAVGGLKPHFKVMSTEVNTGHARLPRPGGATLSFEGKPEG